MKLGDFNCVIRINSSSNIVQKVVFADFQQSVEAQFAGLTNSLVPVGTVIYTAGTSPPAGYLRANGAELPRAVYSELFAAIGTAYGAGDGSSTFNLPDLRGEFLRSWDDGRGADSGRALASAQAHGAPRPFDILNTFDGNLNVERINRFDFTSHANITQELSMTLMRSMPSIVHSARITGGLAGMIFHRDNLDVYTQNEVRPRNMALLACIKY